LIEHSLTSQPIQHRLYGRRILLIKRPNQVQLQYQVLKEQTVHRQIKHTISRHEHKTQ